MKRKTNYRWIPSMHLPCPTFPTDTKYSHVCSLTHRFVSVLWARRKVSTWSQTTPYQHKNVFWIRCQDTDSVPSASEWILSSHGLLGPSHPTRGWSIMPFSRPNKKKKSCFKPPRPSAVTGKERMWEDSLIDAWSGLIFFLVLEQTCRGQK